jgi:hypothetical protein
MTPSELTSETLLAATLAIHFYELDRRNNFWHLDRALRHAIAPACERLRAALDLERGPR